MSEGRNGYKTPPLLQNELSSTRTTHHHHHHQTLEMPPLTFPETHETRAKTPSDNISVVTETKREITPSSSTISTPPMLRLNTLTRRPPDILRKPSSTSDFTLPEAALPPQISTEKHNNSSPISEEDNSSESPKPLKTLDLDASDFLYSTLRNTRKVQNNDLSENPEIIPPPYETCFKKQEIMVNNEFIRIQMLERGYKSGKNKISDTISEKNTANEDNIDIQFFVTNTYIIDPRCTVMKLWKGFNSIMIVLATIFIPIIVGFHLNYTGWCLAFKIILDITYWVDLLLNFITAHSDAYDRNVLDTNIKTIVHNYIHSWFIVDFISIFPFDPCFTTVTMHFRLLQLLRLLRAFEVFNHTDWIRQKLRINPRMFSLTKLFVVVLVIAHLFSCTWYYCGRYISKPHESWLYILGIQDSSKFTQYISSLYWSIVTIATVGYGDLSGNNSYERLVCILTQTCGAVTYGYLVGDIGSIYNDPSIKKIVSDKKIIKVKQYCRDRGLSHALTNKILKYYKYFYRHKSVFDEEFVLSDLSDNITNQIVSEQFYDFASYCPIFIKETRTTITELLLCLRPMFHDQGDLISHDGWIGREIYFIQKGETEMFVDYQNSPFTCGIYFAGHYFGDISTVLDIPSPCSFCAATKCDLLFITKNDLARLMKKYSTLCKKFMKTASDRLIEIKTFMKYLENVKAKKSVITRQELLSCKSSGYSTPTSTSKMSFRYDSNQLGRSETLPPFLNPKQKRSSVFNVTIDSPTVLEEQRTETYHLAARRKNALFCDYLLCNGFKMKLEGEFKEEVVRILKEKTEIKDNVADLLSMLNEDVEDYEKDEELPPYVYLPDTTIRAYYNCIILLLIFLNLIECPYRIAFGTEAATPWLVIKIICYVFFLFDMFLSTRTAYYNKKTVLIKEPKLILRHYLEGWFFIDLLAILPLDLIFPATGIFKPPYSKNWKGLKIFYILPLLRLFKLNSLYTNITVKFEFSPNVNRMTTLLFEVFYIAHCAACVFYYFSTFESYSDRWTITPSFVNASLTDLYIGSLYWSFSTITTTGYGDLSGRNDIERIVSIILVIIGSVVFAWIIGGVSDLVTQMQSSGGKNTVRMNQIAAYLDDRKIPQRMVDRVFNHYQFLFHIKTPYGENSLLNELPEHLSTQIVLYVYRDYIPKIMIFKDEKDFGFVAYMMTILDPVYLSHKDFLYHEGEYATDVYFIVKGKLALIENIEAENEKIVKYCIVGEYFGEEGILGQEKRTLTAKAVFSSQLFSLNLNLIKGTYHFELLKYKIIADDNCDRNNR